MPDETLLFSPGQVRVVYMIDKRVIRVLLEIKRRGVSLFRRAYSVLARHFEYRLQVYKIGKLL